MYKILSSYWLAHLLFDEKIHQSAPLFRFRLRAVRILQIFTRQAGLQRTIADSPAFWEHGLRLCPHNPSVEEIEGLDGFLYEAAENFEVFSNIQD